MSKMTVLNNTTLVPTTSLPSPNNFAAYSRMVASIPQLTAEEENELVEQWQKDKNAEAAKRLVLGHLYLVVKLVRSHAGYGVSEGDLAQEGTVGLMKAVHKFESNRNVRLATYAWYWIEAEMKEFILKNWRLVSWGTSTLAKKLFFGYRKTVASLKQLGEERHVPSGEKIAEILDVSVEDAEMARSYFLGADIELFTEDDASDDVPYRAQAVLSTEDTPEKNMQRHQRMEQMEHIKNVLPLLTDKQQAVVEGRFLTNPPLTLSVLSSQLGVSVERVRQIENEAIKSLQKKVLASP